MNIPYGWRLLGKDETPKHGDRHEAWKKYWFPIEMMIHQEISFPLRIIRYEKTNTQNT
jgi:hypothetical protein